MDNTRDLPGYKYYVDPQTGERPRIYVAYLDLVEDPATAVNGVVFAAVSTALTELDSRERNYKRREVTSQIDPPAGGRVWAYFGTPQARGRFNRGRASGIAVVNRPYLDGVRDGFAELGPEQLDRFESSTDAPPVPVRTLTRLPTLAKPLRSP